MKILIVLAILVAAVTADNWSPPRSQNEIKAIRTKCQEQHSVAPEVLEKLKSQNYPADESLNQYLSCFTNAIGLVDEGRIKSDRVLELFKLTAPNALQVANDCADKTENHKNTGDWVRQYIICLIDSPIGNDLKESLRRIRSE